MITIGLDDTDIKDTRGTNAIARELLNQLDLQGRGSRIVRHQLLDDPRVPYTSRNGSASIVIEKADRSDIPWLIRDMKKWLLEWFIEGSDPGLCVTDHVPDEIVAFGKRCKVDLIEQSEARELAAKYDIYLEGLGGTNQGIIGALASIGLISTGDDGRLVHLGGWPWPDEIHGGLIEAKAIYERGVDEIRVQATGEVLHEGRVDIVKNLRPNIRGGKIVLFVEATPEGRSPWKALKPT